MSQLRALVGLRWRMVRRRRVRVGLFVLAAVFPLLVLEGTVAGQSLRPGKELLDVLLLAPTAYVIFAVLAVVAPLVVGGGNELFPEGQLVAYPVRPRTVFSGSVLLAPLNLAWATQVVAIAAITAAVADRGPKSAFALVTALSYVAFATVLGQAAGWWVIGLRQRPVGRHVTSGVGVAVLLAALALPLTGSTTAVLDHSPTTQVVIAAIQGSQGAYGRWAVTTVVLLLGCLLSFELGSRACAWTLRRTCPAGAPELAPVARRAPRRGALRELMAVDWASVWRSTPLRRGLLVLAILPGGVAMFAHPTWVSLTLLPGLVAAGAGLLFGVNAFCLDGSGAVWVASLPHPQRITLLAKLAVVARTCLGAVVLAEALALLRVRSTPSLAEGLAAVGSVLGSTLLVVSSCARTTVTRPHKADLRGPRDTPAPPATMAVYSMRLAFGTTWAGLVLAATGASGSWAAALVGIVLVLSLALRSLVRTFAQWDGEARRAHVVMTVSYG